VIEGSPVASDLIHIQNSRSSYGLRLLLLLLSGGDETPLARGSTSRIGGPSLFAERFTGVSKQVKNAFPLRWHVQVVIETVLL
jgi:hypothetical protein